MDDKEGQAGTQSSYQWKTNQGGFRSAMFIFVMSALESMGFVALMTSLVLYFWLQLHFDLSDSANTLTNFMGSIFLLTFVGGFVSDTYLTRPNTVLIFGLLEILGLMLLTVQAHYPQLKPEKCTKSPCIKGGQAVMFYATLCLLALGSGGVRGSLPAHGGDQFNQKDPKERKSLASFFNWLLLSITIGASFGVTFIAYINMHKGWDLGFFICMMSAFVGFLVFALGWPFYRVVQPSGEGPLKRIAQVIVVSFRNRRLPLPESTEKLYETNDEKSLEEEKIPHTNQFRFLDKAAILREASTQEPWKVCTVTQVEEVKILTRMLPIIASTIIMNTCLAQLQTFSVHQGNTMNLHLGSFKVPPASIPVIPLLFMSILVPVYEFFFIPFVRKITNHPSGISHLQRVGVGLVLSVISMGTAGIVEVKRRNQGIKDINKPISLFWLSFQYAIFGIADMFTLVGLLEFFYKEAPSGMKSLSTSFTFLSMSMGYFLSTVFVDIINSITKRVTESKKGWLHGDDLNKNNLDLFYWFLAILSCINFANYLFWASWYKYKMDDSEPELMKSSIEPYFPDEDTTKDIVEDKIKDSSSPDNTEGTKDKEEEKQEDKEQVGESLEPISSINAKGA